MGSVKYKKIRFNNRMEGWAMTIMEMKNPIGKILSEEHKANISAALKGIKRKKRGPMSDDTKAKISASLKGMKRTPKQLAAAAARKGRPMSNDTKAKISAAHTGKKMPLLSIEAKENIRLAALKRWADVRKKKGIIQ